MRAFEVESLKGLIESLFTRDWEFSFWLWYFWDIRELDNLLALRNLSNLSRDLKILSS